MEFSPLEFSIYVLYIYKCIYYILYEIYNYCGTPYLKIFKNSYLWGSTKNVDLTITYTYIIYLYIHNTYIKNFNEKNLVGGALVSVSVKAGDQ